MRKFVFSLESVLKAKEILDRQKVHELSMLMENKKQVLTELTYLEERRNYLCLNFEHQIENGIPVTQVKIHFLYLSRSRDKVAEKEDELAQLKKDEAEIRLQLMEIRKDKKMLETLKEKKLQEYQMEIRVEEERLIDELVSYKEIIRSLQEV
ncbi:MAG: flagellar export protein FliJ [Firmicutes bacterium]|nr:flagellar export protein FliJ [Bacillota bacterium]